MKTGRRRSERATNGRPYKRRHISARLSVPHPPVESTEELHNPLRRLFRALLVAERGEPEASLAHLAEARAGRADDVRLFEEQVEEFPALHIVRALEPDIR